MNQKNYEVYFYTFGSLICVEFDDDLSKMSLWNLKDYVIGRTILLSQSSEHIFTKNGNVLKNRHPNLDKINQLLEQNCLPLTKHISINSPFDDYRSFEKLFVNIVQNVRDWERKFLTEYN